MRVLLSTGQGRLHLVQSAVHIARQGVEVHLIQGWTPKNPDSKLVRALARIAGHRNLAAGLDKRRPDEFTGKIFSCAFAEFSLHFLYLVSRKTHLISFGRASRLGCRLFGWQSKRYLRDADVFHVRSSAGQGGAIERARRRGMKIVVDQSALHPDLMKENTQRDFERWGIPSQFGSDFGIWTLVMKDCRAADTLLVNSEQIKKSFVERGFDPDGIEVAYLGVREDFFGLKARYRAEGKLSLLFTGSFSVLKGAEYLLEMMRILKERKVDCELTVVGTTGEARELIDFYAKEELPIRFVGHVPQDKLKSYLAEADVYVFPSLADGCASSGMEAMAAGLCVVATAESGLPLSDGETGYLVPLKDARSLARKIEWLSGNREMLEKVGRAAAELIRSGFTWRDYAARVCDVYRRC